MGLSEKGRQHLIDGARAFGIVLDQAAVNQLSLYLNLIEETNTHTNLTRITGDQAVAGHFLDALSLTSTLSLHTIESVVDIGTGLGVPGVVLKIAFPHLKVLLLDSLQKRVAFLDSCIGALRLKGVTTLHGRAEDIGHNRKYRGQFHLCTARAVAHLKILTEYGAPLIRENGFFAAYKGQIHEDEINCGSAHGITLGLGSFTQHTVVVPELDAHRTLLVAVKERDTPSLYPRTSKVLAEEKSKLRE